MTVFNGQTLLRAAPIKDMATQKIKAHGVSYGLSEAGYDIRIKQAVHFKQNLYPSGAHWEVSSYIPEEHHPDFVPFWRKGKFTLASAIEEFHIPRNLVGVVHDKSTWARQGLSVFNTVVEPGWNGFLTLELVYHGSEELFIPAGAGIAQVIFSQISNIASYGDGKYQNQEDRPVESRWVSDQPGHMIGQNDE